MIAEAVTLRLSSRDSLLSPLHICPRIRCVCSCVRHPGLPLFAKQLSPEFQLTVFPMLKPVSVTPGEIIFRRGAASTSLCFLLSGEVDSKDPIDNLSTILRLTVKPGKSGNISECIESRE